MRLRAEICHNYNCTAVLYTVTLHHTRRCYQSPFRLLRPPKVQWVLCTIHRITQWRQSATHQPLGCSETELTTADNCTYKHALIKRQIHTRNRFSHGFSAPKASHHVNPHGSAITNSSSAPISPLDDISISQVLRDTTTSSVPYSRIMSLADMRLCSNTCYAGGYGD